VRRKGREEGEDFTGPREGSSSVETKGKEKKRGEEQDDK